MVVPKVKLPALKEVLKHWRVESAWVSQSPNLQKTGDPPNHTKWRDMTRGTFGSDPKVEPHAIQWDIGEE